MSLQFADLDAGRVQASIIAGFEAAAQAAGQPDFRLFPGDERRVFLEAVALMIAQQNSVIDLAAKSNLLRYAGEDTIEELGYLYGTRGDRLQATPAVATIDFTLSTTRPTVTTIPSGTRLAVGNLMFATIANLNIPIGQTVGRVQARCDTVGAVGNGFLPGQINTLVDRNPFVLTAINVTESTGGGDIESLEAYRARLRLVPDSFSVAGPDGAYEFWAKTAHPGIIDVAVWMPMPDPGPGHVYLVPLMAGGNIPTQDILDLVYATCNDRTIRPLTDFLHVFAPTPVTYDIELTYWIDAADATRQSEIIAAVEAAAKAYELWQRTRLGRDIIPSRLTEFIMQAGARGVRVDSPVYTELERDEVAHVGDATVTFGGIKNGNTTNGIITATAATVDIKRPKRKSSRKSD